MANVMGLMVWDSGGDNMPFVSRQVPSTGEAEVITNTADNPKSTDDKLAKTTADIGRTMMDSCRSVPEPSSGTEG